MRLIAIACLIAVAGCKTNDDGAAVKDIEGATTPGSWQPGSQNGGGDELEGTGWAATYTVGGFAGAQAALHRIDEANALVRQNYAYVNPCNGGAMITCSANGYVLKIMGQALKATLQNDDKGINVALTCKVANGPGGQGFKCVGQDDSMADLAVEEPAPVEAVELPGKAWKIVYTNGGFAGPQAAAHRVKANGTVAVENYAFLTGCTGGQTITCKSADGTIQFKMSKTTKKGQIVVGEELATPLTCAAGSAPQGDRFVCAE